MGFFADYCQQRGVLTFSQLRPEFLKVWVKDLEIKRKPTTVARKIASLRILMRWAEGKNLLPPGFIEKSPTIQALQRLEIEILPPETQQALINQTITTKNLRNQLRKNQKS